MTYPWKRAYFELRDSIVGDDITLTPGCQIPDVLDLVDKYDVPRNEVQRALTELRIDGLIEVRSDGNLYVLDPANPRPML